MTIQKTLRQLRKTHGWSQEKMAEKLNLSTNGYARLERGERKLDFEKLQQIAMLFKIDVAQLVEAEEKGLIIQQSIKFHEHEKENHNNQLDNHLTIYSSSESTIIELNTLKTKIEFLEKLLILNCQTKCNVFLK